jgi:hypothetical protein
MVCRAGPLRRLRSRLQTLAMLCSKATLRVHRRRRSMFHRVHFNGVSLDATELRTAGAVPLRAADSSTRGGCSFIERQWDCTGNWACVPDGLVRAARTVRALHVDDRPRRFGPAGHEHLGSSGASPCSARVARPWIGFGGTDAGCGGLLQGPSATSRLRLRGADDPRGGQLTCTAARSCSSV